jgi:hypothetical protein
MYYDRDGQQISLTEFSKVKSRVAEDTLPNGYWVSTVWIGLDHSFGGSKPLIFETMVFPHDGQNVTSWGELDSDRYSTEAEALAGHRSMVEKFAAMPRPEN